MRTRRGCRARVHGLRVRNRRKGTRRRANNQLVPEAQGAVHRDEVSSFLFVQVNQRCNRGAGAAITGSGTTRIAVDHLGTNSETMRRTSKGDGKVRIEVSVNRELAGFEFRSTPKMAFEAAKALPAKNKMQPIRTKR